MVKLRRGCCNASLRQDDDDYFPWTKRKTTLRNLEEGMSKDPEVYCD